MQNIFLTPHPSLSGLINNILISTIVSDGLGLSFPFPPLPEHFIIFYPHDRPVLKDAATGLTRSAFPCTIVGPQTDRFYLQLGKVHTAVKIGLQPGALHRLTHLPMSELLEYKDLDGEAVFGKQVREALDKLALASEPAEMKLVAEDFIRQVSPGVRDSLPLDKVFSTIIRTGGLVRLDDLARNSYLSNRHFSRMFETRIGLSPKFYCRLVRFGNAWLKKEMNPQLTWTSIAHSCGYFDQMHLIRDFREFAQANPRVIAAEFAQQPFSLDNRLFH